MKKIKGKREFWLDKYFFFCMPKIQAKLPKQDKRFIHSIYKELLQTTEKNTIIPLGGKKGELTWTNFSHKQKNTNDQI